MPSFFNVRNHVNFYLFLKNGYLGKLVISNILLTWKTSSLQIWHSWQSFVLNFLRFSGVVSKTGGSLGSEVKEKFPIWNDRFILTQLSIQTRLKFTKNVLFTCPNCYWFLRNSRFDLFWCSKTECFTIHSRNFTFLLFYLFLKLGEKIFIT